MHLLLIMSTFYLQCTCSNIYSELRLLIHTYTHLLHQQRYPSVMVHRRNVYDSNDYFNYAHLRREVFTFSYTYGYSCAVGSIRTSSTSTVTSAATVLQQRRRDSLPSPHIVGEGHRPSSPSLTCLYIKKEFTVDNTVVNR